MRVETTTRELYAFAELSEKAKEKAIEECRDINVDFDGWHELLIDEWKKKLEALGFENPEISYSGFWSQGDGASFTCDNIDILKWMKAMKRSRKFRLLKSAIEGGDIVGKVYRSNHHYYHARSVTASLSIYNGLTDKQDALIPELEKQLDAHVESLGDEIYKALEKEYDYLTSAEAIIHSIEANEYEFTVDGKLV